MTINGRAFVEQLRDLELGIRNNTITALRAAVQVAEEDAKSSALFRDRSSALRATTRGTVDASSLTGELRAATKYARYVESGTPPHIIKARSGGLLRFVVAGQVRFARSVRHPGTAERPFMQHARDVGDKTIDYGMDYFVGHAIGVFNQRI